MSALLLSLVVIILTIAYKLLKPSKHGSLPSPGFPLPVVGHIYKLVTEEAKNDPVNFMWNLYKKYQRGGILYLRLFTINSVYVGDFDTLKYIFNHPDVQLREGFI